MAEHKQRIIQEMLMRTNGNRTHTAKLLGIAVTSVRSWIGNRQMPKRWPLPRSSETQT